MLHICVVILQDSKIGKSLIKSLKLGKSSGPNRTPLKLVKTLQLPISSDLAFLINESLSPESFQIN